MNVNNNNNNNNIPLPNRRRHTNRSRRNRGTEPGQIPPLDNRPAQQNQLPPQQQNQVGGVYQPLPLPPVQPQPPPQNRRNQRLPPDPSPRHSILNLGWEPEVKDAFNKKNGGLAALQMFLRTISPVIGSGLLSTLSLNPVCNPSPTDPSLHNQPAFVDLLGSHHHRAFFTAGAVMLATPIAEKLIFRLNEIDFRPAHNRATPEHKEKIQEAAVAFLEQAESLIGIVGALGASNSILLNNSGYGPAISTTVGAVLNLLVVIAGNFLMHKDKRSTDAMDNFNAGNVDAAKTNLRELAKGFQVPFGVGGTLGLGGAVAAMVTAFTQYEGKDDKTGWLLQNYLPALAALYILGSSLLDITYRLHRSPATSIEARGFSLIAP